MAKSSNSSKKKSKNKDQDGKPVLSEAEKRDRAIQNAIKEMNSLKDKVQSAIDNNTFDVFIDNHNQVSTIVRRTAKNLGYAINNSDGLDKINRKKLSEVSLSYNDQIDELVFKLQGLLLKVANKDCPRKYGTSYYFEIWRLYLKLAIDCCLIVRSINETHIGTISNYSPDSILFNGNRINQDSPGLAKRLKDIVAEVNSTNNRLKKLFDIYNKHVDRLEIKEKRFIVRKSTLTLENMMQLYQSIKSIDNDLVGSYHDVDAIDNQNQFVLKIQTANASMEVLRRYLEMILAIRNIIDLDPLLFMGVYLADRQNLDESAKKIVEEISEVYTWLIAYNGIVNEDGVELYRNTIQRLFQLPCNSNTGETLSILEIDKMNLNCFNKIPNLTSWDLMVLDLLKSKLFKLNVIFNSIYDENMKSFSEICEKRGVE